MTDIQYTLITLMAMTSAASILFFDNKLKIHNRTMSIIAWIYFSIFGSLVLAVMMRNDYFIHWLLIALLCVQTLNILIAKGNVSKLQPDCDHQSSTKIKKIKPGDKHA